MSADVRSRTGSIASTALAALILASWACGSSEKAPASTQPVLPATASSTTVTRQDTAGATATPAVPIRVSITACRAAPAGTFVGGAGTIPGPTPTPVPSPLPRTAQEIAAAAASYGQLMAPVAASVQSWIRATDDTWQSKTPAGQAELLAIESARLAALCQATSAITPDYALRDAHSRWVAALESRQGWMREAANGFACCGRADTAGLEAQRAGTAAGMTSAASGLEAAVEGLGGGWGGDDPYEARNALLGVAIAVPAGWIVARNDSQVALIGRSALQLPGEDGLGIDGSGLGSYATVRRLRKSAGWTLDNAADQAIAVLTDLGSPGARQESTLSGAPALELDFESGNGSWTTRVVIVGPDDFAYFIQMGCPSTLALACRPDQDDILREMQLAGS